MLNAAWTPGLSFGYKKRTASPRLSARKKENRQKMSLAPRIIFYNYFLFKFKTYESLLNY